MARYTVHLCHWPATELDSLIPAYVETGEEIDARALSGSIQVSHDCAYFEILIGED